MNDMVKDIRKDKNTLYACEACGLRYETKAIAEQCEKWCREHSSCNLEIIKHAVPEDSSAQKS